MMGPAFANAASILEPDMRLVKLNSQDEPEMASQLRIRGIPTMLLFVNGREVARTSGAMNTSAIVAWAREQAVGYS
jgi:thioredoxin 2